MAHDFDPGYNRSPFKSLVRNYPGPEVYPPEDFRTEWGPIFHRGRLNGSARLVVIGQDPAAHEAISRRVLVGEAGQRVQGLLAKLGITKSYVMVNTFLYSVYGQGGGARHSDDEVIAEYRNKWLDALIRHGSTEAVITFGKLAGLAFEQWKSTVTGALTDVASANVVHPTYPESASAGGQSTKKEAMKKMLHSWNEALDKLSPALVHRDAPADLQPYGEELLKSDLREIPEADLPAGAPPWMRSLDAWAARRGDDASEKRATIEVRVPRAFRTWA